MNERKKLRGSIFRSLSLGLLLVSPGSVLQAQDTLSPPAGTLSRPTAGSSAGAATARPPRIITGSQDTEILRHRDFGGKPCLAIGGFAGPHATNSNLYDHVIEIKNGCAQSIKTQICYLRSLECITLDVQGHMTKEGILGTLPSIKDFQYEFRERF